MKRLIIVLLLSISGVAQSGMLTYSGSGISFNNAPVYVPFAGGGSFSPSETIIAMPVPTAGTISALFVQLSPAPSASSSYIVTLRDRATNASLTCVVNSTSCSDLVNSSVVAQGDTLDWQIVSGGPSQGIQNISITAQFVPSALPNGLVFLCQASTPVASLSIGPCVIPSPPAGKQWRKIIEIAYVSAYGSPGDTVGDRYNGNTGNNYRFECNTMAAGGTTFAVGANTATAQSVLKMAPADSNLNRNIMAIINSDPGKTEKTVQVLSLTGTNSVSSQAAFDLCNGAYISPVANEAITSVTQVTLTANMGANSGFALFGIAW